MKGSRDAGTAPRGKAARRAATYANEDILEFFENAALSLHWVGKDGTILRANQFELDFLGYSRAEYEGHHISEFHVDQPVIDDILRRLGAGETLRDYPARLRAKDGSIKHVLINSNVRWVDGEFVHTRCFTRDVTATVRAEDKLERAKRQLERAVARRTTELRRANDRLRELVELKERFVAMVSHELRTPLTSISGFSSTMQRYWDSLPDDQKREFVEIISNQSDRLSRLVNDLLTLSRISSGTLDPRIAPVAVEPVVTATVRQLGVEAVTVKIRPGVSALADPDYLQQILVNYLANAVKYGDPPFVVEARRVGESVEIRVSDRGPGVAPEFVERLFEEFAFRTQNGRHGGTGLGLSIVRRLAAAQGGEAWFEPARSGATFALRLPAASAPRRTRSG